MAKFEYDIDYRKQYPDVTISDEVLAVLRESDLKRKYCEYDLKVEKQARKKSDETEDTPPVIVPSREDSLDRLTDLEKQFASPENVEETVIQNLMLDKLRRCLTEITASESEMVTALFFNGLTERQLSEKTGVPQKTINDRKCRLLRKLKKLLENKK